ncbi:MAG: hypothetical protein EP343_17885 [Deltaproteobacteria bacterium]|nr:MAG: hypothetical protein EP343_17885 [Deltaproteobacteria bacterium]
MTTEQKNHFKWGWWLELFVASNLGFLALDVYVAHSANRFAHNIEWLPVYLSLVAPVLLVPAWLRPNGHHSRVGKGLGYIIGGISILVGVAGFLYHLADTFFVNQTLKNLVYTAPFAAPLAYTGLGLLLCLNRMEPTETEQWGSWVLLLALGGFIGNFVLTLADHAQNGFFMTTEWIAVGGSALTVGFLMVATFSRHLNRGFAYWCLGVLAMAAALGAVGFVLHWQAGQHATNQTLWQRLVYGAPLFAPLLFADLAALAALGLLQRMMTSSSTHTT